MACIRASCNVRAMRGKWILSGKHYVTLIIRHEERRKKGNGAIGIRNGRQLSSGSERFWPMADRDSRRITVTCRLTISMIEPFETDLTRVSTSFFFFLFLFSTIEEIEEIYSVGNE